MSEDTRVNLGLVSLTDPPLRPYAVPFPPAGTVYDYQLVRREPGSIGGAGGAGGGVARWVAWREELKEGAPIPRDAQFNEIIVPTVDTVRYALIMDLLVTHAKACLFVGPTGTGKSVYIIVRGPCFTV